MANYKSKKKNPATKSKQKSKAWMYGLAAAAAVVIVVVMIMTTGSNSGESSEEAMNQPFLGDENAQVEVIEFGDYKCPYCKAFEQSFFPQIDQELVQTGDVKFTFMNYPFINVDSNRSAEFAEVVYQELGNDVFWEFHSLMYEKQTEGTEQQDIYTEDYLFDTLEEITDEEQAEQVLTAFQDGAGEEAVDYDLERARNLNVTGTPALFVNGEPFEGETIDDLKEMVEEAKAE
ncbi:DsbA family protein [Bacillus sp. N1-1]|uniref:DsbA family protein n=1 Tax=Bacillus sp. N1-1 TaxID=2682541 RepID=UPI001317284E|nr:DsbA family protein [Bacillus sp. N1-1]QHA93738.1 thioredoxin domain-containing protein [Bacillus sp. N1-1]